MPESPNPKYDRPTTVIVYDPLQQARSKLLAIRMAALQANDLDGYMLAANAQHYLLQLNDAPQQLQQEILGQIQACLQASPNDVANGKLSIDQFGTRAQVLSILESTGVVSAEILHPHIDRGALRPVPEFDWRVDRTLPEIRRRLGMDPVQLLEQIETPENTTQYTLDLGAGNGTVIRALGEQTAKKKIGKFVHMGISDAWYYPLSTLIDRVINFEQLEAETGAHLTRDEREAFGHFLYAFLSLKDPASAAESGHVEMNRDIQSSLAAEPNMLIDLIRMTAPKLLSIDHVPNDISVCANGQNEHRQIISQPTSATYKTIRKLFCSDPQKYLCAASEVRSKIPFNQQGMMIGDFASSLQNFPDRQFSYIQSCRGTVFVSGQAYEDLMVTTLQKLNDTGIGVFDCVRKLNGSYYALDQLLRIRERVQKIRPELQFYVTLGPGIEGQDFRDHLPVPISFSVTASPKMANFIRSHAITGPSVEGVTCVCVPLDAAVEDDGYLKQIDSNGNLQKNLVNVQTTQSDSSDAVETLKI